MTMGSIPLNLPSTHQHLCETAASLWGVSLSPHQCHQFATYATELQRWNEQTNLTAITSLDDINTRHFLDSLRCAASWGTLPRSMVDVGAGAGFPGLPLKIAFPSLHLTLVESTGKKVAFLEHMVATLGLESVTVLAVRAEAVGHDAAHREQYDVAVARAVAGLPTLVEYCLPLVRVGGRLLAPKGAGGADEAQAAHDAIEAMGGRLCAVEPVVLPGEPPRTLVVVEKVAPTPPAYPRAVGVPARRPL